MRDRIVQHANRYKLTPVSGDVYDLTPEPGIVTEPGTDLNKANLLKDATAALYGLGADAVPDEALALIAPALNEKAKIAYVSYTGTGTSGSENPNSLTFDFAPQLMFIQSRETGVWLMAIWVRQEYSASYVKNFPSFVENGTNYTLYSQHSNSGKTISWYYTTNAMSQLNTSGATFDVTAIGLGE